MSESKKPKPRNPTQPPAGSEHAQRQPSQHSGKDIAILNGPTEDGQGTRVLRIREGTVSAGEIRPAKEGEPITNNELVRLHPLDAERRVCAVEVLHAPPAAEGGEDDKSPAGSRRARVSTANYRKNWSTIFETKRKRSEWSVN